MNTTARTPHRPNRYDFAGTDGAEQLTLLPSTATPARFRLSADTRERGLRHVAEIRQMLATRNNDTAAAETSARHDRAA